MDGEPKNRTDKNLAPPAEGRLLKSLTGFDSIRDRLQPWYVADLDRRLIECNKPFLELSVNLFPEFRRQERREQAMPKAPQALLDIFNQIDQSKESFFETISIDLDGQETSWRAEHFSISANDRPAGYAGSYIDISSEAGALQDAARDAERDRDTLRAAADWSWETDSKLVLTHVSEGSAAHFHSTPENLIGRGLFAVGRLEIDTMDAVGEPDFVRTLMPFDGRIFLIKREDGGTHRLSLSGHPYFDDKTGDFAGYRGTATDISALFAAEERSAVSQQALLTGMRDLQNKNVELSQALEKAKIAASAKTDFLGRMSHELRTPLNAILGFSELSLKQTFGEMPARYLDYFQDINQAAGHLLTIINDILDAVNIEAGKISIIPETVDIADLIADARTIVAGRASEKGVDIASLSVTSGFRVVADPVRTRQILINLMINAIKFTESGGSVGVDILTPDAHTVDVAVWDTGIGIPADQKERIFEGFHQLRADAMNAPSEGAGLGLTISRQLARLMGGDLIADSRPGKGSRFTLRLPVSDQTT